MFMNGVKDVAYLAVLLGVAKLSDDVPLFSSRAAQNAIVCTVLPSPCVHTALLCNTVPFTVWQGTDASIKWLQ